nr:MAG TPA: hypothetical protein [Caudoviricetes sp.]
MPTSRPRAFRGTRSTSMSRSSTATAIRSRTCSTPSPASRGARAPAWAMWSIGPPTCSNRRGSFTTGRWPCSTR